MIGARQFRLRKAQKNISILSMVVFWRLYAVICRGVITPSSSFHPGGTNACLCDGSVRFLTDLAGSITDTYDYDAFGNLISQTGATSNNYLYSGEQFDPDLGLYHLRARYHNPDTGRFWSMDGFEGFGSDPQSLHKYTYCGNNPVNSSDPSGNISLSEVSTAGFIGAAMGPIIGALNRGLAAYLEGVGGKQISESAFDGQSLLDDAEEGFVSTVACLGVGKAAYYVGKGAFYAVRQGAPFLLRNTPQWVVKPLSAGQARLQAYLSRWKNKFFESNTAAKTVSTRAMWAGTDGLEAAAASGAKLMKPSAAALRAMETGNMSLMQAESAAWAKGATGEVTVFFGNGAGRTFLNHELPELLNSINSGRVSVIDIAF
jgi:RHS repeat-associated protein/prepilin-type processing-associated H-X9-DG protein